MKRLMIILIGMVGLVAVRGILDTATRHDASVTLEASDPAAMRLSIIGRLTTMGAVRVAEDSSFGNNAESTLTFRLPVAQTDAALAAFEQLGAKILDQKVQFAAAAGSTQGAATQIESAQTCLKRAAGVISAGGEGATAAVAGCQAELRGVVTQLDAPGAVGYQTEMTVRIISTQRSSPWMVTGIFLAIVLALAIGGVVIRMLSRDEEVDIRSGVSLPGDQFDDHPTH